MKTIGLWALLSFFFLPCKAQNTLSKVYKDVSSIKIIGNFELLIAPFEQLEGKGLAISTSIDEKYANMLRFSLIDSVLYVGWLGGKAPKKAPKISFTLLQNNLRAMELQGDFSLTQNEPIRTDSLLVQLSGKYQANLKVEANTLHLLAKEQGQIDLKGQVTYAQYKLLQHVALDASLLEAQSVDLRTQGNATLVFKANQTISGVMSGESKAYFIGQKPDIQVDMIGEALLIAHKKNKKE